MSKIDRFYRLVYLVISPVFQLFHPVKAVGRENIPEGAAVVCPNHTAMSDPFFVVFAFKRRYPLRVMAKMQIMKLPFLGWLLSKAGVFGVNRNGADVTALKTAMKVLKEGHKLLMFPEGTRVGEGENVEAKTGAAMLAVRNQVPLVPVYVPAKKKWFRPTKVVIGKPFQPQVAGRKGTAEEYHAIAAELMERVRELEQQAV